MEPGARGGGEVRRVFRREVRWEPHWMFGKLRNQGLQESGHLDKVAKDFV